MSQVFPAGGDLLPSPSLSGGRWLLVAEVPMVAEVLTVVEVPTAV